VNAENRPPLLEVAHLETSFFTEDGIVKAADGVDFCLGEGEVLGIVGESGCGKSVTALSIMRLIGVPGRIVGGDIRFEGRSLLKLPEAEMRALRGNCISMIFQQPQTSLNPVYTVGSQLASFLSRSIRPWTGKRPGSAPWNCCTGWAFQTPPERPAPAPTRCRAGRPSA